MFTGLYLIEILHQTTTGENIGSIMSCCILSKFYIKPQPSARVRELLKGCILSKFYIKPQPCLAPLSRGRRCILSKFYIKPQLGRWCECHHVVVSYRNSTSNHNESIISTSFPLLYLIEILHQTTTPGRVLFFYCWLYLIEILHQTTTTRTASSRPLRCILSKFYIKPQHLALNGGRWSGCILSKFYIKPQQSLSCICWKTRCILSKFYIKPQLLGTSS